MWFMDNYVIHVQLRDSRKTTWFTYNYVIHAAPVETTVGILIVLVKNYMTHVKRRDSRRTTWFTSNDVIHVKLRDSRLAEIFLVEKNYADLWWRWELILSKKTLPKLRNSWLWLGSNAVCFLCRFNSFSPGQIAIHVGNSGIHENPRFLPLLILNWSVTTAWRSENRKRYRVCIFKQIRISVMV